MVGHPADGGRHQPPPRRQQQGQEGGQAEEGAADGPQAGTAEGGGGREPGQQEHGVEVLHQQDAQHRLLEGPLDAPLVEELGENHRGGDGEAGAEEGALQGRPAQEPCHQEARHEERADLQGADQEGRGAGPEEALQAELQADGEHEQDDAQLAHDPHVAEIRHQRHGHVGPDDHARQEVAQDRREAEALEEERGQGGHAQHHRQVHEEAGVGFHGRLALRPRGPSG
jgi:hypothetical protein